MKSALWSAVLSLVVFAGSPAPAQEDPVQGLVEGGKARCAEFENGAFSTTKDSITHVDLNGDGVEDMVVDEFGFECSSAMSIYCGTGGCDIHAIVDGAVTTWLAKSWTVIDWDDLRVVLLRKHGAECGATNLRQCVESLVWSDGGFRTVKTETKEAAK